MKISASELGLTNIFTYGIGYISDRGWVERKQSVSSPWFQVCLVSIISVQLTLPPWFLRSLYPGLEGLWYLLTRLNWCRREGSQSRASSEYRLFVRLPQLTICFNASVNTWRTLRNAVAKCCCQERCELRLLEKTITWSYLYVTIRLDRNTEI